jgi:hypothetical protein
MTLLNFPSDPASVNNVYVGPNGVRYIFDGVKWVGQSAGGGGISTELVNGSNHLSMNTDGSVQFPHFTFPAGDGTNGQVLKTNGSGILTWHDDEVTNLPIASDSVAGVIKLGEGFRLDGSNKVTTNKLYSTNTDNPNQHYRLTLDTSGVVTLPDQSIINGSTLRGIYGTGEANFTGITIGPDSNHREESWVWVDKDGSHIATRYSGQISAAKQWDFDNTGKLTLPNGTSIGDSRVVLGPFNCTQTNYFEIYFQGIFPDLPAEVAVGWKVNGLGQNNATVVGINHETKRVWTNGTFAPDHTYTFTSPTEPGSTKLTVNNNDWTFDNQGDLLIPNGGHIKHQDGTPYSAETVNTGNYTFSGDNMVIPLHAKLNSGGVGITNSAEFGTEVTKSGSTVTHSEIYMGSGTAEARAITDGEGRSLMYLGVENVGEGKFAGIVAQDPNLDPSQYTTSLNGDGLPILGDSTVTYATTVGVMNSDFTINGLYVDEIQTVVATGAHAWYFDRNGDVTVPGQIKDVQGNRAVWSNEVPRDVSDLTDNSMLLGMSNSTIDINIDGGGAYATYEGTLVRADGGFSSTRWGVNSTIYDGGLGAGGGAYSETLNGGGA